MQLLQKSEKGGEDFEAASVSPSLQAIVAQVPQ